MSNENVDLACRAIEAWNTGGAQEAKQYWAEDYEFHDSPTMPDPKVVHGREAVATHLTELATLVGDMRLVIKDAHPFGEDGVVILMEMEVHGAESGVVLLGPLAQVAQVADGQVRRTLAFLSWEEGLEFAGLGGSS